MVFASIVIASVVSTGHGFLPNLVPEYEEGMSLIQLSHSTLGLRSTDVQTWDIDSALKDMPSGAYLDLINPVAYAVRLSYTATHSFNRKEEDVRATIPAEKMGGGTWERLFAAEVDPPEGLHAVILHDRKTYRAIIAFRGLNLSPLPVDRNRDADLCAADAIDGKSMPAVCNTFSEHTLDYLAQGKEVVQRVQKLLPGYAILLSGHSLGAKVAVILAATLKNGLKAVTFALSAFTSTLVNKYGFGVADFATLNATDLIAIEHPCDPIYLQAGSSSGELFGTTVCLYKNAPSVAGCLECSANLAKNSSKDVLQLPECSQSFYRAHVYKNYLQLIDQRDESGKFTVPDCRPASAVENMTNGWQ